MPKVTIIPAIKTPKAIEGIETLGGTLNTKAHSEAVQAPVRGKGTATKIVKAKALKRMNLSLLFISVL